MGPCSHNTERLVWLAIGAIWLGVTLPVYQKAATWVAAQGVALAWYQRLGLFVVSGIVGAIEVLVFGLLLATACWAVDYIRRLVR
jgi:hypothetical protein